MKDNIPKIVISNRLFNADRLFKQFEELEEYVDVNFDNEGEIPDYIEFDRTDELLKSTVEELLTVYVNNKISTDVENLHEDNVREFIKDNKCIESTEDNLKHVFPILMFKKGTIKIDETVIDIERMIAYFMDCNKEIQFLIQNYDQYYEILSQTYLNSLIFDDNKDKFKKLHTDAMVELEYTLLLIQEILTDSLFNYLNTMFDKMIDNVVHDDYKFDISLKYALMKNAGEMRILDFIKEKRILITEALTVIYYKATKLLKIKDNGDDL